MLVLICSGYMAPEYAMHGQFSVKSDVFSFGVLLLEIVCGQRNNSFRIRENEEDLLSFVSINLSGKVSILQSSCVQCEIKNFAGMEKLE